jgi:CvfB-like winged helix domain/SAP domain
LSRKTPRLFLLLFGLTVASCYVHVSTKYFNRNAAILTRNFASKSEGEYEDLTVVELKRILREKGLPVSGVKAELVTRLTASSSNSIHSREGVEKNEIRRDAIEDYERGKSVPSSVRKGMTIEVKVVKYGALGASVEVVESVMGAVGGLILQDQLDYWVALNGREPRVGEVLNAYVQKVRDDGKLDIALRPVGYDKVTEARDRILEALEQSKSGSLPVGDKSSPEDVWAQFPGMSKGQFKTGIGALLREGAVKTSEFVLTLIPKSERVPMAAQPYSGKSPRGWVAPEGSTLFIGNLPFTTDNMR